MVGKLALKKRKGDRANLSNLFQSYPRLVVMTLRLEKNRVLMIDACMSIYSIGTCSSSNARGFERERERRRREILFDFYFFLSTRDGWNKCTVNSIWKNPFEIIREFCSSKYLNSLPSMLEEITRTHTHTIDYQLHAVLPSLIFDSFFKIQINAVVGLISFK